MKIKQDNAGMLQVHFDANPEQEPAPMTAMDAAYALLAHLNLSVRDLDDKHAPEFAALLLDAATRQDGFIMLRRGVYGPLHDAADQGWTTFKLTRADTKRQCNFCKRDITKGYVRDTTRIEIYACATRCVYIVKE